MNKYSLTPTILDNIGNIERFYGQLEALRIPKELRLNIERNNMVQSSYISNSIEGNPLSHPEVTNLLLGDRVPVNRSEKEVRNYYEVLKSLKRYSTDLFSLSDVLSVHYDLMTGVDDDIAGRIRDGRVVIGSRKYVKGEMKVIVKHEPPYHDAESIEKALAALISWFNGEKETLAVIKIALFHHQYVYIHPFADGNGRTVRLLTALLLIRAGYSVNKYFVLDDYYDVDRPAYSDALHSADAGDSTAWVEYFTSGIRYSLQSALAKTQNALLTMRVSERPTKREQQVLKLVVGRGELTSAEVADILGVSRQQAQNLLGGLVRKNLIKKIGHTKKSYYQIED